VKILISNDQLMIINQSSDNSGTVIIITTLMSN